jgi:hypothetical protein
VQESRDSKLHTPYSRRALAAYRLVKAAVELNCRGIRSTLSSYCDLPATDMAKWAERNHRRWQKKTTTEELLEMVRREWEILQ